MNLSDFTKELISKAIEEDIGSGDYTTLWSVSEGERSTANIIAKGEGIVAGIEVVKYVFHSLGETIKFEIENADGTSVKASDTIAQIEGNSRTLLSGERVALNFLQRLSGIATLTSVFVEDIKGTYAKITDTRKTTPCWRELEKYAVRIGGGVNHRFGLFDMVMIKDNHIAAAGGIKNAVNEVKKKNKQGLYVVLEVKNLTEVEQAIELEIDRIMLDNFSIKMTQEAVKLIRDFCKRSEKKIDIEASGGITLENVREIAEAEVDFISIGALTHSAPALDMSMLFDV